MARLLRRIEQAAPTGTALAQSGAITLANDTGVTSALTLPDGHYKLEWTVAGETGAVGHADTRSGPAVFYRLGLLRVGDTVEVGRKDRRVAVFTVDSVRVTPKRDFPDALVYGPTERAELRLITCGGKFDRKTGYESNTVVFAHLPKTR